MTPRGSQHASGCATPPYVPARESNRSGGSDSDRTALTRHQDGSSPSSPSSGKTKDARFTYSVSRHDITAGILSQMGCSTAGPFRPDDESRLRRGLDRYRAAMHVTPWATTRDNPTLRKDMLRKASQAWTGTGTKADDSQYSLGTQGSTAGSQVNTCRLTYIKARLSAALQPESSIGDPKRYQSAAYSHTGTSASEKKAAARYQADRAHLQSEIRSSVRSIGPLEEEIRLMGEKISKLKDEHSRSATRLGRWMAGKNQKDCERFRDRWEGMLEGEYARLAGLLSTQAQMEDMRSGGVSSATHHSQQCGDRFSHQSSWEDSKVPPPPYAP